MVASVLDKHELMFSMKLIITVDNHFNGRLRTNYTYDLTEMNECRKCTFVKDESLWPNQLILVKHSKTNIRYVTIVDVDRITCS